jgi:translation initiation factor IF-3
MRPGTDMHDLDFKLKNARRFLMDGDKVKVTVMFRGREMVHQSRGRKQLDQVLKLLEPLAKMETAPRMEGRFMSMILVGERDAIEAARKAEEQAEKAAEEAAMQSEAEPKEPESAEAAPENEPGAEAESLATGD